MTTEPQSDQLLVERVQAGDPHAFNLLVIKYQSRLMRLVLCLIQIPEEAEYVVQETFIKAFRGLYNFRGDSAFNTWLYQIGVNTVTDFIAAKGRRMPSSIKFNYEEVEALDGTGSLRDINTFELASRSKQIAYVVNRAIGILPLELRAVIVLREMEGLSYKEISEVMACPVGTVRGRIFQAREIITEKLKLLLDFPVKQD